MRTRKPAPTARKARPFARAIPLEPKALAQRKRDVVRGALAAAGEGLFIAEGFDRTTIEQIARAAGVSRRKFFRYFDSKEELLAYRADQFGEQFYGALAARPAGEAPLVAIRHALVLAMEGALQHGAILRYTIRMLRETNSLRRVVLARHTRLEERVARLMARRLEAGARDNTPMLLAFLTRALIDTAFNAWYDHDTDDVAGLVDDLAARLRAIVRR